MQALSLDALRLARRARFSHPASIALVTIARQHISPDYHCDTAIPPQ